MLNREVTGKSGLLQEKREINQNRNKYPSSYTDPPGSVVGNKEGELKDKPSPPVESAWSHDSPHVWADKQSSPVQSESTESKMESPPTVQQSSIEETKQQR